MPQILLVNPSARKKTRRKTSTRKNPVKKRRTAKQKAATRKLVALNRRRARGGSRRRTNPVRRKTTRRKATRRRSNPVARRRRTTRRRSSPAFTMRSIQNQIVDAGWGAAGALGLDVVQGYLPLPANLKVGLVGTGVKALLAIGIGVVGQRIKLVRPATAAKMANGALTVVLHDELKKQVANFAPGIQMGEYLDADGMGYYGSGYSPYENGEVGSYLPSLDTESMEFQQDGFGMNEYIDGSGDETGYMDNF